MSDRKVSLNHAVAAALWGIGVGLIVAGLLASSPGVGHLGVVAAMGGATLNVRQFMCYHTREMGNAFALGRDARQLDIVPPQQIR